MNRSAPDNSAPLAFFEEVRAAYQHAAENVERTELFYAVAGSVIQLSFAGTALLRLITPALEHRQCPPQTAPDLHIHLWDAAETGVPLPPRPWQWHEHIARSDITSLSNERFQTAYNWPHHLLDMLDLEQGQAFYCTRHAAHIPSDFGGSPLLNILHWWMRKRGLQYVHAGAIGLPDKGVLLAGAGGSGKSTTALATLNSDLVYVSDDYCLISSDPQPYAYNIYSSAKVHHDNLFRLPHLQAAVSNADTLETEKALIRLHQHYPHKIVPGLPICAIFLPRPTGQRETRIVPVSRTQALKAVMVSTMVQLAGSSDFAFKTLSNFVRQVPCYDLQAGTDLDGLISAIRDFLLTA
jgi:hypothetical protein